MSGIDWNALKGLSNLTSQNSTISSNRLPDTHTPSNSFHGNGNGLSNLMSKLESQSRGNGGTHTISEGSIHSSYETTPHNGELQKISAQEQSHLKSQTLARSHPQPQTYTQPSTPHSPRQLQAQQEYQQPQYQFQPAQFQFQQTQQQQHVPALQGQLGRQFQAQFAGQAQSPVSQTLPGAPQFTVYYQQSQQQQQPQQQHQQNTQQAQPSQPAQNIGLPQGMLQHTNGFTSIFAHGQQPFYIQNTQSMGQGLVPQPNGAVLQGSPGGQMFYVQQSGPSTMPQTVTSNGSGNSVGGYQLLPVYPSMVYSSQVGSPVVGDQTGQQQPHPQQVYSNATPVNFVQGSASGQLIPLNSTTPGATTQDGSAGACSDKLTRVSRKRKELDLSDIAVGEKLFRQRRTKKRAKTSSQYRGVSWHKRDKCWMASIWIKGKIRSLGNYSDERKAALAVDEVHRKVFGQRTQVSMLNFPTPEERKQIDREEENEAR